MNMLQQNLKLIKMQMETLIISTRSLETSAKKCVVAQFKSKAHVDQCASAHAIYFFFFLIFQEMTAAVSHRPSPLTPTLEKYDRATNGLNQAQKIVLKRSQL